MKKVTSLSVSNPMRELTLVELEQVAGGHIDHVPRSWLRGPIETTLPVEQPVKWHVGKRPIITLPVEQPIKWHVGKWPIIQPQK